MTCLTDHSCAPQNGKTEYKSITYSPDATAQEFSDLYFDDDFRPTWVSLLVHV